MQTILAVFVGCVAMAMASEYATKAYEPKYPTHGYQRNDATKPQATTAMTATKPQATTAMTATKPQATTHTRPRATATATATDMDPTCTTHAGNVPPLTASTSHAPRATT
ncbi:unnamed protein product, partial [Owenia fusiformis]